MRIGLVNCAVLPEPDFDERPMLDALSSAGHDACSAAWDDSDVDWGAFDLAVIRATWNYFEDPDAFTGWIDRVSGLTTLVNPADTLKWNMHKSYLGELEQQGVAIIPTAFVHRGASVPVVDVAGERGWGKVVIKPTVSAGSFGTRVFDLDADQAVAAQMFLDEMIASREMMIQRYMPSVDMVGETALVVIDGELTHAIEKRPRFDDQEEEVYLRESISDEMRDFATRVLDASGMEYLYARVDVIPDDDGAIMLSEVEMLEPSLFFPHAPHAVDVFVRGVEKRLAAAQS